MKLTINDTEHEFADGSTLQAVVAELGLVGKRGLAVAVNGGVVPAARWSAHGLGEGDQVILIQATQGG